MELEFDLKSIRNTEFGIGRDDGNSHTFVAVPVDGDVQVALNEMVNATWNLMKKQEDGEVRYEPSDKHAATEYLYLPLDDSMVTALRELHEAANLDIEATALSDASDVFCYLARITDEHGRRLTAIRRATQFKGVLKHRLIRLVSDTMKLIEDTVFKLDVDFDILIDSSTVHILRPSGFEFVGKLQQAILDAVGQNVAAIQSDIAFVNFDEIAAYASRRPRAARYLASIRAQAGTTNINKASLKKHCRNTGVEVTESKRKLVVAAGHEMGFLEVLDRRRYELELVKGQSERFTAASRKKLD